MRKPLSLVVMGGALAWAAAAAAEPKVGSDEFCAAMMDHADQIWPLDQVRACAPWRARKQAALNKAVADCHAAHPDALENLGACDSAGDAATVFWEKSQYVQINRDTPPEQANPVIHPRH